LRRGCFELDYGDTTTVSGNTITQFKNGAIGIDIQQVAGPATVSNNIITGNLFSTGIYSTTSTDLTITGNNIVVPIAGNGIKLFNDSLSIVENNHLAGGHGISIDDSTQGSGNTVKSNTIKEAGCGIDIIYLNGTVTTPDTVFTTEDSTCTVI